MLMEDELHYDDDDENGEFEGIVNETDIINPSKDCDYDVDYNDMAARFESFLSRAQLASPASSPSTSEVKTSAESAVDTMEMETPAAPAAVIPAEVRRSNNNNNFCLLPPHVTKGPYADGGGDGDPGQRCPGPGLRHDPAERRPAPPPRPPHPPRRKASSPSASASCRLSVLTTWLLLRVCARSLSTRAPSPWSSTSTSPRPWSPPTRARTCASPRWPSRGCGCRKKRRKRGKLMFARNCSSRKNPLCL